MFYQITVIVNFGGIWLGCLLGGENARHNLILDLDFVSCNLRDLQILRKNRGQGVANVARFLIGDRWLVPNDETGLVLPWDVFGRQYQNNSFHGFRCGGIDVDDLCVGICGP